MTQDLDVSQIFGMIIAIIAIGYTLATTIYEMFFKKQQLHPKPKAEEALYKQILGIEEDDEDDIVPQTEASPPAPPPGPSVGLSAHPEQRFTFEASLDHFKQKSSVEERTFDVHLRGGDELISGSIKKFGVDDHFQKKRSPSRIEQLLKKLPSKQACIIAKEIIDPPIGMR